MGEGNAEIRLYVKEISLKIIICIPIHSVGGKKYKRLGTENPKMQIFIQLLSYNWK